jgi:hypothetical protein
VRCCKFDSMPRTRINSAISCQFFMLHSANVIDRGLDKKKYRFIYSTTRKWYIPDIRNNVWRFLDAYHAAREHLWSPFDSFLGQLRMVKQSCTRAHSMGRNMPRRIQQVRESAGRASFPANCLLTIPCRLASMLIRVR